MTERDDLRDQQEQQRYRRFETKAVDLSKMKPVEFVHPPFLVRGRLNNEVGEEKVGKSTFICYLAASMSVGELPGIFEGTPKRVLFVGADEDDFYSSTVPRLVAAGADMDYVEEFIAENATDVFNIKRDYEELHRLLGAKDFGLVAFEHLMDILPPMSNANDPTAIRHAVRPLRRVLASRDTCGLGALHVNKAQAQSFRQKTQGSMQWGAMARSSFLIDRHPKNPLKRVAVLGPANYVRDDVPHSVEFVIKGHQFSHGDKLYDEPRVEDVEDSDVSMEDVLSADNRQRKRGNVAEALKAYIREGVSGAISKGLTLDTPSYTTADLARAVGQNPKDQTVRRALDGLAGEGFVSRGEDKRWRPTPTLFDDDELDDHADD